MWLLFTLAIVGAVVFYLKSINKGISFEEECAAKIQELTNEHKNEFLSIGECRAILRQTIHLLNQINLAIPNTRIIPLRKARIIAVETYKHMLITDRDPDQIILELLNEI